MTPDQNHYEVLGVSEDASESEIEKAFYQRVREHPPEQDQEGHERIREAYDVLSNPVSRREYDNLAAHGEKIEQLKDEAERILNQDNPDFEKAIKKLKKAVVLGPEIGLLRNYLGQAYLQNGTPEDALQQFDKAVELDETNTSYRLNRGHALERLDQVAQAERAFRSVWEEDEGDYAAARALAGVLFHQEKVEEAHEVLDTAIWADDKLDFEDFFCYHDKLQFYVAQGKTEILEEELETVKGLPETEDDRKYAAFVLAQTGQMLVEVNVYRLALEFVYAAVELDPENPRLRALQEFVREQAQIEQSFEEIAESSSIHEFVKHVVAVFYQRYLGVIDEEEFNERSDEIGAGLQNVMGVDPDNTEIKESVRHIRDKYPEVFQLNESAFESILSRPDATHRVDDCPHCEEPVRFEKGQTSEGRCPSCDGPIAISGDSVSTASGTYTSDIFRDLRDMRERLNERAEEHQTPLHQAASEGDLESLRELLEAGEDPNQVAGFGRTPLHDAASARVAKLLLEAGADPRQATTKNGLTPLHDIAADGREAVAKVLLEAGVDINARCDEERTPLHKASLNGHVSVVEVLLEAGGDFNAQDEDGQSPLHLAAEAGASRVLKVLLSEGADPDQLGKYDQTPLHEASTPEVALRLLKAGANPNGDSQSGSTPLHEAAINGYPEVAEVLIDSGANLNVKSGSRERTPLHWAAYWGNAEVAYVLLQKGADPDRTAVFGETPLLEAETEGHPEVVEVLLNQGANPDRANKNGQSPLSWAASEGDVYVVEMLLEAGADQNRTTNNGLTPLHKAASNGRGEVVKTLIRTGADLNRSDKWNRTPLDLAEEEDHHAVVRLLRQHGGIKEDDKGWIEWF